MKRRMRVHLRVRFTGVCSTVRMLEEEPRFRHRRSDSSHSRSRDRRRSRGASHGRGLASSMQVGPQPRAACSEDKSGTSRSRGTPRPCCEVTPLIEETSPSIGLPDAATEAGAPMDRRHSDGALRRVALGYGWRPLEIRRTFRPGRTAAGRLGRKLFLMGAVWSLRIPILLDGVHRAAVDMSLLRGRHTLAGSPAKVAEELRGFQALGVSHVALEVSYSTYVRQVRERSAMAS